MNFPLSLTALSCSVFTTAGRYLTFNLEYHVTTTRWQNPKALSTLHLITIFLYLCHFEVWHHKFNTGRGDVMKQHSYSQKYRWMNKLCVVKIPLLYRFKHLSFENIFSFVSKICPVHIKHQRSHSDYNDPALCMFQFIF